MKQIAMSVGDLTRIRFAISPILTTVLSVRSFLQSPTTTAVMQDWHKAMVTGLDGHDLTALRLFHPLGNHTIDFMFPFPAKTENRFDDELQRIACTSISVIEAELDNLFQHGVISVEDISNYKNLPGLLMQAVDELALVWRNVMCPNWEKINAVLQNDIVYRSRTLANGGVLALFQGLSTDIHLESSALLSIYTQCQSDLTVEPNGHGLLFVPFFFSNSSVWLQTPVNTAPTVSYQAYGAGAWNRDVTEGNGNDVMLKLFGKNRANLLYALIQPTSTKHLALKLNLTSGAISQQLNLLKEANLITSERRGRSVYYLLNEKGKQLLHLFNV
ncbi:MAG: hypothetical protein AAFU54_21315 [Chloroflexota bacterium]